MKRILLLVLTTFNVNSQCQSKIAQGETHTIGIKTDGSLWVWGRLGVYKLPFQLGTALDWKEIACGSGHFLALKNDGTLWFSGANFASQGGTGTSNSSSTFIQVGVETNWSKMSACYSHSLAIKKNGTLWAWAVILLVLLEMVQPQIQQLL